MIMALEVEAIYEKGQLQLLSPVTLQEGEKVRINIVREHEQLQSELNAFLASKEPQTQELSRETEVTHKNYPLSVEWGNGPTASEMIIEERESREY
jgi:predicted DNA-binding antitoxin AbrB/MazE fold protein